MLVLGVSVMAGLATFAVARFGSMAWPTDGWHTFAPPDGDCRVEMPAPPTAEEIGPNPEHPVFRGGQRFVVRRSSDGLTAEVGWLDLDPEQAPRTRPELVIIIERDRRAVGRPGMLVREAVVRVGEFAGREYQFETDNGIRVERYLYDADSVRPRLYVVAASGREWQRVIDSFQTLAK